MADASKTGEVPFNLIHAAPNRLLYPYLPEYTQLMSAYPNTNQTSDAASQMDQIVQQYSKAKDGAAAMSQEGYYFIMF